MASHRTTPNGIASYRFPSHGPADMGPYPARITAKRVRVNGYLFDIATKRRIGGRQEARLLSYTITPKDIPE